MTRVSYLEINMIGPSLCFRPRVEMRKPGFTVDVSELEAENHIIRWAESWAKLRKSTYTECVVCSENRQPKHGRDNEFIWLNPLE